MADAGSSAWTTDHPLHRVWTNLSHSWTQVIVRPPFNDPSNLWETISADMLWLPQPPANIRPIGAKMCEFSSWLGWSPWLAQPGRSANKKLGCFAAYCWKYGWNRANQGNTYGTIKLKLASVRWYHRRHIGIDLTTSPDFTLQLRGIKRLSPPVHKLQPITTAFLRLLYSRLNFQQQPQQRLLWDSLFIGFFFLLRRSEYLKIGQARRFYCLKLRNTFFSDSEERPTEPSMATFGDYRSRRRQEDQFGRGAWRTMHASGDKQICPVSALKHIIKARRTISTSSQYLCADLSAVTVAAALKATARSIGVPEANYLTHSVRIGGATALLSGEASPIAIKLLGRWLSNCFEQYPTQAASATTTLARRMVGLHTPTSPRSRPRQAHQLGGRSPRPQTRPGW